MAHQHPNTANIPTDAKLFGKEMRSLWRAPKNRLLVGVDAEGIQLRIFAHYIDDKEFTDALVNGKKEDKTDPHSLNQQILQAPSRNHAKRFIFAYLLGGGIAKLSQILEMSTEEGEKALQRLVERYSGLQYLRSHVIPADAKRGWFTGIDGRAVKLPGESLRDREHLCMSGYLQNGEAVVMKAATVKFADRLDEYDAQLVNLVHDEWQTECPNNVEVALNIARLQADCLREVGEELKLNCPLAGSYYNEDIKDYTLGVNWSYTH
jgi:DNA polymerase-1